MTGSDPGGGTDAAALAATLRLTLGRLTRRLRDQGQTGDLTGAQISVLGQLDREGPATVTALARAEGMRPQSLGATIASLEEAGLVAGAPDPRDGRQTILSVTPACKILIETIRAARNDWLLHAIESKLSRQDQEDLGRSVILLQRILAP